MSSSKRVKKSAVVEDLDETPDSTDKKKATHLRCERQRREAINSGYQELKELLPSSLSAVGCKTTNASILFRGSACEYIGQLQDKQQKDAEELRRLNSQLSALQIICQQYEQLSSEQSSSGGQASFSGDTNWSGPPGQGEVKFRMMCALVDNWFDSFQLKVCADDYGTLAKTLLLWLETGIDFENAPRIMAEAARNAPPTL